MRKFLFLVPFTFSSYFHKLAIFILIMYFNAVNGNVINAVSYVSEQRILVYCRTAGMKLAGKTGRASSNLILVAVRYTMKLGPSQASRQARGAEREAQVNDVPPSGARTPRAPPPPPPEPVPVRCGSPPRLL